MQLFNKIAKGVALPGLKSVMSVSQEESGILFDDRITATIYGLIQAKCVLFDTAQRIIIII